MASARPGDKNPSAGRRESGTDAAIPFGPILAGLADAAREQLVSSLEASAGLPVQAAALTSARLDLLSTMSGVSALALWDMMQESGSGFTALADRSAIDGIENALADYPVLLEHVRTLSAQWVAHLVGIANVAALDLADVRPTQPEQKQSGVLQISGIEPGWSDRHGGGRTVTRMALSNGRTIAYKPRSLSPEGLVARVLSWLDEGRGGAVPSPPWLLDRESHGWMEWVEPADCTDSRDVHLFFRRSGAQLLVLHLLGAVDCHAENLIARGAEPVLIDAETLGHPEVERFEDASVLRTGYLPYWKRLGGSWIGMGGLGSTGIQESPWEVGSWQNFNTDRMALNYAPVAFAELTNLPVLDGRRMPAWEYADDVVSGYIEAGRAILERRGDLDAGGGPLDAMEDTKARFLARPTQFYGELLESTLRPAALKDADQVRQTLTRRLREAPGPPSMRSGSLLTELIRLEVAALMRMDIPRFEMRLGSTTLQSPDGEIERFVDAPGSSSIRNRFDRLSVERLEGDSGLIRAALAMDALYHAGRMQAGPESGVETRERRFYPFRPRLVTG